MVRDDIAWAAGLFEGEGCLTRTHPRRHPSVQARVSSTDRDVVEHFRVAVGFGYITGQKASGFGHKYVWQWQTERFEYVQAMIAFFWPWLGERRRGRARELLTVAIEWDRQPGRRRPRRIINDLFPGKKVSELKGAEVTRYLKAVQATRALLERGA